MIAHTYNSSYLGGTDQLDQDLRPTPGKNLDIISKNKPDMLVYNYNLSYVGGTEKRIVV
jgi:hypothetical protein